MELVISKISKKMETEEEVIGAKVGGKGEKAYRVDFAIWDKDSDGNRVKKAYLVSKFFLDVEQTWVVGSDIYTIDVASIDRSPINDVVEKIRIDFPRPEKEDVDTMRKARIVAAEEYIGGKV